MKPKSFLEFKLTLPNHRKTEMFDVTSATTGLLLGRVYFRPQWRKFVFEPSINTLYDAVCLSQIAGFCDAQTDAWRRTKVV